MAERLIINNPENVAKSMLEEHKAAEIEKAHEEALQENAAREANMKSMTSAWIDTTSEHGYQEWEQGNKARLETLSSGAYDHEKESLKEQKSNEDKYSKLSLSDLAKAQAQAELDEDRTTAEDIKPFILSKVKKQVSKANTARSNRMGVRDGVDSQAFFMGKVEEIKNRYKAEVAGDNHSAATESSDVSEDLVQDLDNSVVPDKSFEENAEDAIGILHETSEKSEIADDGTKVLDMEAYIAKQNRKERISKLGKRMGGLLKNRAFTAKEDDSTEAVADSPEQDTSNQQLADVVPITPAQRAPIEDDALPVDMEKLIAEQDADQEKDAGLEIVKEPIAPEAVDKKSKKEWKLPEPDKNGRYKLRKRDLIFHPSRVAARDKAEAEFAAHKENLERERLAATQQAAQSSDDRHLTSVG